MWWTSCLLSIVSECSVGRVTVVVYFGRRSQFRFTRRPKRWNTTALASRWRIFLFFSKQTTEIDESKFRPSRPEPVRGFFLLSIDCSATNPIKLIRSCLLADCTGCLPSFTELFIVLPQHWFDFRWIFTMLPCSVVFYRVFVGYYRVFIYLARSSLI